MNQIQRIFRTIFYSRIIIEYNVWNHDFMLETQTFFFQIPGTYITGHAQR